MQDYRLGYLVITWKIEITVEPKTSMTYLQRDHHSVECS